MSTTTFFATWLRLIRKHPVAFNSLNGCVMCASSDAVAQYYENKHRKDLTTTNNKDDDNVEETSLSFRIRRAASAGLIGFFFGGWVYPMAYARLDALWKGTHFTAVLQKSLVEIATVGIFVNSVSMVSRGLLVGRETAEVAAHVVEEMPVVTLNDARVWLPYNMLAFSMIPATIRPTTTLMMEAGWQTYISLMSNNYQQHDHFQDMDDKKKERNSFETLDTQQEEERVPLGILNGQGDAVMASSPK